MKKDIMVSFNVDAKRYSKYKDICRQKSVTPAGELNRHIADENDLEENFDKKFYFCLDINANIFCVRTPEDYGRLPKYTPTDLKSCAGTKAFIDFEECQRRGIDAIEYFYTESHKDEAMGAKMDEKMMGWDCDSILILNPEIIIRESFLCETERDGYKYYEKG